MKKLFKEIYHNIPFKRELFSVIKTFWQPGEPIYRHLYFVGVFKVKVEKFKAFKIKHYGYQLENEIFWAGLIDGWEKESTKLWINLCKESKVIFDIGANTGIFSLIAKTVNPAAKVYAFEPVERVFEKFKENIALNNFDIIPVEKAVSDSDGEATIYDTTTDHVYSVTVNKNLSSPDTRVVETKIETITLDTYIRQNNIQNIDLMKIDVETHEPEVLEGFNTYFVKFKPTLLIEILNDEVGTRVQNIVNELGYLYFNIDERGGIRQVKNIVKSDYYNYLFCSPAIAEKLGLIKNENIKV